MNCEECGTVLEYDKNASKGKDICWSCGENNVGWKNEETMPVFNIIISIIVTSLYSWHISNIPRVGEYYTHHPNGEDFYKYLITVLSAAAIVTGSTMIFKRYRKNWSSNFMFSTIIICIFHYIGVFTLIAEVLTRTLI